MENIKINVEELINSLKSTNLHDVINSLSEYYNKFSSFVIPENKFFSISVEEFDSSENYVRIQVKTFLQPFLKIKSMNFKQLEAYFEEKTKSFIEENKEKHFKGNDFSYYGHISDAGLKEGQGLYEESNSYRYFGGWKDNKECGNGLIINKDQKFELYIGEFNESYNNNEFKGFSILFDNSFISIFLGNSINKGESMDGLNLRYNKDNNSLDIYQGVQKNFKKDGLGILLKIYNIDNTIDFEVYYGHFRFNDKKGKFKVFKPDHHLLWIDFQDNNTISQTDEMNILKYKNKSGPSSFFFGQIEILNINNEISTMKKGKGTLFYNNNRLYKGFFNTNDEKSFKDSTGEFYIISGNNEIYQYVGKFVNDEINQGKIYRIKEKESNLIFEGQFENNQLIEGTYYYDNGEYKGTFKNNQREGKGKYIYKNKAIYDGEWFNNLREGIGFYQELPDGPNNKYKWRNDKIVIKYGLSNS